MPDLRTAGICLSFVVRELFKQNKDLMPIKLVIGIFCNVAYMIRKWRFLDTNTTKEITPLARGWREHGCLGIPPVLLPGGLGDPSSPRANQEALKRLVL